MLDEPRSRFINIVSTGPVSLLIVQKRAKRAGAQTSLARLVASAPLRPLEPVVLLGGGGWLHEQLQAQNVPVLLTDFPSPRALMTRVFGLGGFVRRVVKLLPTRGIHVRAVIANDHQECPLALGLSEALGNVPVLALLRTPGMSRADYDKYWCERCHALMAVGQELRSRVAQWTSKPVELFEEGFAESEFMPHKPPPATCPRHILVIGSEEPRKGFTEFIEAVERLEATFPEFPGFSCDLTGARPEAAEALLRKPFRSSFQFLGRVEDFADLVRKYDFAVHPSRAETFGLAPIEAILAGTPTLVSSTGVIRSLMLPAAWTFPPGDVAALTERLGALWRRWPDLPLNLCDVQAQIRRSFHIDHTAGVVLRQLQVLGVRTRVSSDE